MNRISQQIAQECQVKSAQVDAAIELLDGGSTVPFIARYRKEVTQGLDDGQLRTIEERLGYLRELEDRKATVLKSIKEQDKLTPTLEKAIVAADSKTRLEDLYLPYKPKRRTKAQIAREAGLEPLADLLLSEPTTEPEAEAKQYVNKDKGFADVKSVLDGARQILMERFAEDAELVGQLRDYLWDHGLVRAKAFSGKEDEGKKFADYFDYAEAINKIPSHRALALLRGRREGILQVALALEDQVDATLNACERKIAQTFAISEQGRAADNWLIETVRWAWRMKIFTKLELDSITRLRKNAEEEAIRVFATNLRDLLMAAPAGCRATMGLDPGLRTGVKVVVVDSTGKLLDTAVIYPHKPQQQWDKSIKILADLASKHQVELISIGNGTASRETESLVADVLKQHKDLQAAKVVVSEAGASVYSASELAAKEFPELDVTLRGAVSIARRLQDPLAELVKIEPKAIGVGQYQHDVNQIHLSRSLTNVVEDCVNHVGVDLNTASVPLLVNVSGLNETIAQNIVAFRDEHGQFKSREQLKQVPRLGEKTFEQAAGFLRIHDGDNPLDASAVHPEAYPVVEKIITQCDKDVGGIIGDKAFLDSLNAADYVDEQFGVPTIRDIIAELDKPGRDPRPDFKTATFKDGINKISDLVPGMELEGVVTNVANFGAFVDVGVHQDGLVHISELTDRFVSDPREVVKTGDIVTVKVLEVDLQRSRVNFTMLLEGKKSKSNKAKPQQTNKPNKKRQPKQPQLESGMAAALRAAMSKES
ncbi:MAG: RNA-binding transcriptional accessory protein [Legionellales bacterium]|nr:RNA-binding transcriptional accessory protein [Legionellales bacterium]|tara:strand:- start:32890 stop:35184 length:2295 start_codon:yes stop_codon:yes gene_type:complete